MSIQWFPGHMNLALKEAAEAMERVDLVIEVLDARAPEASRNPMIERLRRARARPALKLLNKADLADPAATREWLAFYAAQAGATGAAAVSCKNPRDVARIPALAKALAPHRGTPLKPLRMMVMGIPNVGKSTLINALLRRRIAAVGDEPAVTKSQQRLDIDTTMSVTDTPGLLWPKIEYDSDGMMLAAMHAVGRNAVIDEDVAAFLAEILLVRYPQCLALRYGFDAAGRDGPDVLAAIAERRGLRVKGGAADVGKAAGVLLKDYRSGALGRVSLETPRTRAAMLAAPTQEEGV